MEPSTIKSPKLQGRGQALVEAALAIPILLTLTIGAVDIGRAFAYREAVVNAARQGLRLAVSSTYQSTANTVCASYSGSSSTTIPASSSSPIVNIVNTLALEQSSDGTAANSALAGATVTVAWHCSGGAAITNATNGGNYDPTSTQSDAAEVKVSYALPLITPFASTLTRSSALTLVSDQFGRMEY